MKQFVPVAHQQELREADKEQLRARCTDQMFNHRCARLPNPVWKEALNTLDSLVADKQKYGFVSIRQIDIPNIARSKSMRYPSGQSVLMRFHYILLRTFALFYLGSDDGKLHFLSRADCHELPLHHLHIRARARFLKDFVGDFLLEY